MTTKWMLMPFSLAVAALAIAVPRAQAAGPYDGMWIVDAPAVGQTATPTPQSSGCEALRLPFQIVDNKISGSLQRSPYGGGRVQPGTGRGATPVTGTVQPDGTLTAQWEKFRATGKLTGDKAEIRWKGSCGPRVATGSRVAESTGSTQQR